MRRVVSSSKILAQKVEPISICHPRHSWKRIETRQLCSKVGGVSSDNYFQYFGLEATYDLDTSHLAKVHKDLMRTHHPDLQARKSEVQFCSVLHLCLKILCKCTYSILGPEA